MWENRWTVCAALLPGLAAALAVYAVLQLYHPYMNRTTIVGLAGAF